LNADLRFTTYDLRFVDGIFDLGFWDLILDLDYNRGVIRRIRINRGQFITFQR